MRNTYIDNNPLEAYEDFLNNFTSLGEEIIEAYSCLGRTLSRAIFAKKSDPMYNAAAMDGISLDYNITLAANDKNLITLEEGKDFEYINTGSAISSKHNCVIMIEDVIVLEKNKIQIIKPAHPWEHVRVKGETITQTEMVLPSKHTIRPQDIGAILASGETEVWVYKKPRVGIIPTGNEMVEDPQKLETGKLIESNSFMFIAMLDELGAISKRYPITEDKKEKLTEVISTAVAENDLVIVNAGSSAGTKDYTRSVIENLGKIHAHGFAIKPGKPTILASIANKPVIGLPGYPVSSYLTFLLFVKPLILKFSDKHEKDPIYIEATLTKNIVSSLKNTEFVRVTLGLVDNKLVATPISGGAAKIMSLVNADGIISIPRNQEGLFKGDVVSVQIDGNFTEIASRLVITGSHDLIIDIIGDQIPIRSSHVGSIGGIMALLSDECHIAPIHLLDEETGEYNISYIKKYFKGQRMALIKGVGRTQGLILQKGNPKKIKSIKDLTNADVYYANRQRGAGTRILFDYQLKLANISKEQIKSYEKEYTTHLAVGVAVENGVADAGMGIKSAATILGLDFIKVATESYDFLTTEARLNDPRIQLFIQTLKEPKVADKILSLGDYSIENIGEVEIIEC